MEDFGDLLYIVFAIIGIVYSLMKKNNRKAREATPPIMPEDEDAESFEDPMSAFEEDFSNGQVLEKPKPAFVQEPVMAGNADKSIEEKKRQMEKSFERFKSAKQKTEMKKEEHQEERGAFEFDLRQAVIYSEILKRPEF